MEPKLNFTVAAAVLWATLPVLGLGKENLFSFHDRDDPFVDALVTEMKVPHIGDVNAGVICGPLTPDQAKTIAALSELCPSIGVVRALPSDDVHIEFVEQGVEEYADGGEAVAAAAAYDADCADCVRDFVRDLSEQLGVDVTVEDGVIVLGNMQDAPDLHAEPERSDILIDAACTITNDRNDQYGEPENSFPQIAALWNAYLGFDLTPHDVALMMALLKISRMSAGYKRDSYIDAAGYIGIAGELALDDQPAAPTLH